MKRATAGKIAITAWDTLTDAPKTGDAANITAQISKDGGASAASNDANPTELSAGDHPGVYVFDLLAAETTCDLLVFTAKSSTSGVEIRSVVVYPEAVVSDLHLVKCALTNTRKQGIVDDALGAGIPAGTVQVMDDDGESVVRTLTPAEAAGVVTLTAS